MSTRIAWIADEFSLILGFILYVRPDLLEIQRSLLEIRTKLRAARFLAAVTAADRRGRKEERRTEAIDRCVARQPAPKADACRRRACPARSLRIPVL